MYESFDGGLVLQTPILDVLEYFQCHGHSEIDTHIYKRSGRNLFIRSPFRDEKTASFSIMTDTNCWKDFGTGEGAGVLNLVERLSGKPTKEAFLLLAEISRVPRVLSEGRSERRDRWIPKNKKSGVTVTNVFETFTDEPLIRYAASRGIEKRLLDRYCYQISYHFERHPEYSHTNIGFPNLSRGYAFRGPEPYDKGCTSQNITTINSDGKFALEPTSSSVIVFEGFFDFLSYMQYHHDRVISGEAAASPESVRKWMDFCPVSDVVVLNSTSMVDRAIEYLSKHKIVNCCLDNDNSGQKAFEKIQTSLPQVAVIDRSPSYAPYNDFNEFFMKLKADSRKPLEQTVKH